MKTAEEWRLIWMSEVHTPWPEIVKRAQAEVLNEAKSLADLLRKFQDDLPTPEVAEALEKWDKLTKQ